MNQGRTYDALLKTTEWRTRRDQILKRDGYECLGCRSKDNLQVHHRQYHMISEDQFVKPWEYEGMYLVTLCTKCHEYGHQLFKIKTFRKS